MKKVTENWPILYRYDSRPDTKEMTRKQLIDLPQVGAITILKGTEKHWVAFRASYALTVLGDRTFWKKVHQTSLTFKGGRFYGDFTSFQDLVIDYFGASWIRGDGNLYIIGNRQYLWKKVISGDIKNRKDLLKALSKGSFKGAFSVSSLDKYFTEYSKVSLWKIYYYSVNPQYVLDKYLSLMSDSTLEKYFMDALYECEVANQRMDSWL